MIRKIKASSPSPSSKHTSIDQMLIMLYDLFRWILLNPYSKNYKTSVISYLVLSIQIGKCNMNAVPILEIMFVLKLLNFPKSFNVKQKVKGGLSFYPPGNPSWSL